MPREAHTILADADGDTYEIWAEQGKVFVWLSPGIEGIALGTQEQEAHGQAFIAACNAADRQRAAVTHA